MLKLPPRIVAATPYLDSDWVRYGVPAVLLAAIFFVSMRYQTDKVESPPSPPAVAARNPLRSSLPASSSAPEGRALTATQPYLQPAMPIPQRAVPPTAPRPYHQMATGAAPADVQTEGRRALCLAVQHALSGAGGTYSKMNVMRLAVGNYRGQGGPRAAIRAVNLALEQYKSGAWSEAQCPPTLGAAPLAKGAIAEVMR
jgi:hypothetical protein